MVGVFTKKHRALIEAEKEEAHRGDKYSCEVLEWDPNQSSAGNETSPKEIKVPKLKWR